MSKRNKYLFITSLCAALFFISCKSVPKDQTEPTEPQQESQTETEFTEEDTSTQDQNTTTETEIELETESESAPVSEFESNLELEPKLPEKLISRKLLDKGQLSATQLAEYFLSQRQDYDLIEIIHFAQIYIIEAAAENINSDIAFAQMCLETGYLRFGGLVQPEFHNYCGLGAMDAEHPGCIFDDEQTGVRAHIQHLQAYATTEEVKLNNPLVDPRYGWVHKTKFIETIDGLTGTWATDPSYAVKIDNILDRMEQLLSTN